MKARVKLSNPLHILILCAVISGFVVIKSFLQEKDVIEKDSELLDRQIKRTDSLLKSQTRSDSLLLRDSFPNIGQ
jgi:hypothetical protein